MSKTEQITVAGCDCGKNVLVICVSEGVPTDLKRFIQKQKRIKVNADAEGLQELLALNADIYAIEPTGSYSQVWIKRLREAGRDIRLVSPIRVRYLLKMNGFQNKSDRIDSAGIAVYAAMHANNPKAFISPGCSELREAISSRNAIAKSARSLKNRIGSRLSLEWPEGCKAWVEAKRKWAQGTPPIVKAIGDIDTHKAWVKRQLEAMEGTIGDGIQPTTQRLAQQLHCSHEDGRDIEKRISLLLAEPELEPYNQALDRFMASEALRASLIPVIYPFERYLGEDGRRVIEYVQGESGQRSKRDRSEAAFKMAAGFGMVQIQSGGLDKKVAAGSSSCRKAIFLWVKTTVVMTRVKSDSENPVATIIKRHRGKLPPWLDPKIIDALSQSSDITRELASLRIHYECCDRPSPRREMVTGSRFLRMLYKELLKEFQAK